MCIAVVTTGAAPYCCAQSSAVEGRTKQNWNVDEASAWGQSTKRLDMMAAEEARSQSSTHSLPCRDGTTALKCAIRNNKADVAAYLRSIGAPQ